MKNLSITTNQETKNAWRTRGEHASRAVFLADKSAPLVSLFRETRAAIRANPRRRKAILAKARAALAARRAMAARLVASLAPTSPDIASNPRRAARAASRAEKDGAAKYRAAHLNDKTRPNTAESPLAAEYALQAIFPPRGADFRRVRNLCRKSPSRRAAFIAEAEFVAFARRVAGIVIHRMTYGNPRKAAARMGRKASQNARLVHLSTNDREDTAQEISAALWAGNWHGWPAMDFQAWRASYGAARRAIRASSREVRGGDELIAAQDGPEIYMASLRRNEDKRAARLRLLVRAAKAARALEKAAENRQWRGNFRARLADIRTIAARGGFADCVDSLQTADSREGKSALASALTHHATRFAKYIRLGLAELAKEAAPERAFKSFEDMANALV